MDALQVANIGQPRKFQKIWNYKTHTWGDLRGLVKDRAELKGLVLIRG